MSKIIDAKKNGYQIAYTGEKAERFIRPNGEYQQLSYGDRMVGIISHVTELKESIEKKLIVKKSSTGSTVFLEV